MDDMREGHMTENQKLPSLKALGRDAAAQTHESGVWYYLTVALLAAILITHAVFSVFVTLRAFLAILVTDMVTWYILTCVLAVLTVLGWLFLAMPVWFGRLRMAALLTEGVEVTVRDILYYFGEKKRLFRAWRISMVAGLICVLLAVAVTVLFGGVLILYFNVFSPNLKPFFAVLLLLACLLGVLLITTVILLLSGVFLPFVAVALGNESLDVRRAFAISVRAAKGNVGYIFRFTLRQIPHVLLSLVTIGVYYIFWYAPRFVLSYLHLSQVLCPKEDLS